MDWQDHHKIYDAKYGEDNAKFKGISHGGIQWKGTDVCIDLHCICGASGHIDGYFLYHYECAACHRKYALSCNVALIELSPEIVASIEAGHGCGFQTDPDYNV